MKFSTSKAYVAPGLMRKELQISLYSKAWHSANQNDNITSLFWKQAVRSFVQPSIPIQSSRQAGRDHRNRNGPISKTETVFTN